MTADLLIRLHALLEQPDPPELIGRGHTLTQPGKVDRRVTVLPAILVAWVQQRHMGIDPEPVLGTATRSQKVRTRATVLTMKARA